MQDQKLAETWARARGGQWAGAVVGLTAATESAAPGLLGPGARLTSGSPLLTLSLRVLGWDSGLELEAIGSVVADLSNPPQKKKKKKSLSLLQEQWICDPGYV